MKSLALGSLGLLLACGSDPFARGPVCQTSASLTGEQHNGTTFQGSSYQGDDVQGVQIQGVQIQGVQIQGTKIQGANLNGSNLNSIELVGSTLMAVAKNGEVLGPADLIGAEIAAFTREGRRVPLTITGLEEEGGLTYYTLELDRTNVCGAGGKGLFVSGVWDARGARHETLGKGESSSDTTFSCTTGVIAKCVKWGYQPWIVGAELHQTCTRMARADYCGDGVAHTVDGTLIDIFDVDGIQEPAGNNLVFEAGWGPNGAVCVSKPRYPDRIPSCWSAKPMCQTFERAIDYGAQIGNKSAGTWRGSLCTE